MGRNLSRALGLGAFLLASTCLTGVASAQVAAPAAHIPVDPNGVDLTAGTFTMPGPSISIGKGVSGLSFSQAYASAVGGWVDTVQGAINSSSPGSTANGTVLTVTLGGRTEVFTITSGAYVSNQEMGSTLSKSGTTYTYTLRDGTVVLFSTTLGTANAYANILSANEARPTQLTRPTGDQLTYTYTYIPQGSSGSPIPAYRLQALNSNTGYQLHFTYDDSHGAYTSQQAFLLNLTAINGAYDYCSPTVNACSGMSHTWPQLSWSETANTFTDAAGRTSSWSISSSSASLTTPGSVTTTYSLSSGKVTSVSNGVGTWSYTYVPSGIYLTTTQSDPLSHTRVIEVDTSQGLIVNTLDGLSRATWFTYDTNGRLTQVQNQEGDEVQYAYDGRGNITSQTLVPKSGSGLSNVVTSATFPSSCTNPVTCNEPTATTDALGNETDYTYDSTHGGVTSITRPAPTTGAVRPQVNFTYTQIAPYYLDSSSMLTAGSSLWRLTGSTTCMSTSSCSGGPDQIVKTVVYGASSTPNNLLSTSLTTASGDGALSATSAVTYDMIGNVLTRTSPLSGGAQVMNFRWDADREVVGVVGPDPDGAGSLKNRAVRLTYNSDGLVTLVEQGTVNSPSDSDWSALSSLDQIATTYDSIDRPIQQSLASGGTTLQLSQTSYDNADRVTCTTLRMNPSIFGSEPSSACTLGASGSNGPDRITAYGYDAADELLTVKTGYGTSVQTTDMTYTWGSDGEMLTASDGKGQLTTYVYDGLNRIYQIEYPTPSNGSVSSTTDYDQFTYNAASLVTAKRLRDASTISYAYDNLLRLTTLTPPTGTATVTYGYNNLDWRTSVATSSQTFTTAYDQLGRSTSETGPLGTVSYQYDLAGRRTRMTWPDSFYVNYDWDLANELTAVREYGATSGVGVLATFAYDDLGRRTGVTRGDGANTSYSWDSASNLTSIAHTLAGTGNNQTITMTYDAAGAVLTRANSNTAYAFGGGYNINRPYQLNGQNQVTYSGQAIFSFDSKGDLSSDGTNTFGYDGLNRLTGMNSATLSYDPEGRLYQTAGSATTKFLYDGAQMIGEYNSSGTLLRRYVPGAGADEPLVWYEGSGTTDRRWLLADQVGSIITVADGSGAPSYINTYDDYGIPGSSNTGRFQFTGQAWITEAGVYHYKARAYSPTVGRFLQPDPIGYGDGMNLYAYVHNNPIMGFDPTGLADPTTVAEATVTALRKKDSGGSGYDGDFVSLWVSGVQPNGAPIYQSGLITAKPNRHGAPPVTATILPFPSWLAIGGGGGVLGLGTLPPLSKSQICALTPQQAGALARQRQNQAGRNGIAKGAIDATPVGIGADILDAAQGVDGARLGIAEHASVHAIQHIAGHVTTVTGGPAGLVFYVLLDSIVNSTDQASIDSALEERYNSQFFGGDSCNR